MTTQKMTDERAQFARELGLGAYVDQRQLVTEQPVSELRLPQAPDVDVPAALGVSAFVKKKK